jgi:hypothetical protein
MIKKLPIIVTALFIMMSFTSSTFFSSTAPSGYTGELGFDCSGCHGSFAVNSGGGGIVVNGLPSGNYIPGQAYPVSVTISHGTANRLRWGFALAARNELGVAAGSFVSTNPNVVELTAGEVGHQGAVTTPASASYTYTGFSWVAPSNPTLNDRNLRFFAVGNAANGNSGTTGDFIHTAVINLQFPSLPVTLSWFTGVSGNNFTVMLQWETVQEQNSDRFVIERSADGRNFEPIGQVAAAGNSSLSRKYQYTDRLPRLGITPKALYRLKQLDKDGKITYSNAVAVELKAPTTYLERPSPNLVNSSGTVMARFIAAAPMTLEVSVTDASGVLRYTKVLQAATGANMISLPASNFANAAGVYYMVVKSTNFRQTERIIVQ